MDIIFFVNRSNDLPVLSRMRKEGHIVYVTGASDTIGRRKVQGLTGVVGKTRLLWVD